MSTKAQLLKVVPITKGVSKELSYFSLKNIKTNDIVSVPIRKKEVPALVISIEDTQKIKSRLRRSPYQLRRILKVKASNFFIPEFIKACQKTAYYFAANPGNIINELCPQSIFEDPPKIAISKKNKNGHSHQTLLLQTSKKERFKFYKNLIRGEFAKGHSIFLCLPSIKQIQEYDEELKKGIEHFTLSLHGKMSKKELKERWSYATKEKHPLLIIATPLFFSLPRHDISHFVIENEGSPLYKARNRPFIDIRIFAQYLADETNSNLIIADEITRAESYGKIKTGKISLATPTPPKITSRSEQILVDMKKEVKTTISRELKNMLKSTYKKDERVILFLNRRGHGLSTVCNDCGYIITCPQCDNPLVLHKSTQNKFICHKCFSQTKALDKCPYCKGWRLNTLGYGIQKLAEETKSLFPDFKIFQLDSDVAKTKKRGEEIIKNYLNTPGSILITTELLFSFFNAGADRIAVVSIDGMFNLPDFRINERIFRLLFKLKMRARKTFLIQTRLLEQNLFEKILQGNISGFYHSELKNRQAFDYPPFKTLIKIILEGKNKNQLQKEIKILENKLQNYHPMSFPAFTTKVKNLYRFYILLKIEPSKWPPHQSKHGAGQALEYQELHNILSSLPPQYKVDVDPESLL